MKSETQENPNLAWIEEGAVALRRGSVTRPGRPTGLRDPQTMAQVVGEIGEADREFLQIADDASE